MPIRPENRARYPQDWPLRRTQIVHRAQGRCECAGECGVGHGERCEERQGLSARTFTGKVVLTVAHLNHEPEDCRDENLRAFCQGCHNRYDVDHRKQTRAHTRREAKQTRELFAGM